MTNLWHLSLFSAPVTDAWLMHLGELKQLQTLYLPHRNKISDAGLEHLKGLTKLQYLFLGTTKGTDAGVQKLKAALPKCKVIHVKENRLSPGPTLLPSERSLLDDGFRLIVPT